MKFVKILVIVALLFVNIEARERVNVNFSNVKIVDLITIISKMTHKNILLTTNISGSVNFVTTAPIYDDELIGILITVLESKGYTLVQQDSIYKVVRSSEAAKQNVPVVSGNKKSSSATFVTQAIKIKYENVDIIAAKIRYLLSKSAKLMTLKENNTLLITDYQKNIATIKQVLKFLDKDKSNTIEIVAIKNIDAKRLLTKLNTLQKALFNQKIVSQKVTMVADENTNNLLLVGNRKNLSSITAIIKRLDIETDVGDTIEVFKLKNSDAKAVSKTLNDIVSKKKYSDAALKPNISVSEEINAVVVIGDPIILKGVAKIIQTLDREKYQVYVQAKIIEINKEKSENIGIKYGFAAGDISSSGLYAMSANFGSNDITNLAFTTVSNSLGADIIGVSRSALALGAAIDFLRQNGAAKSISNPSILCVNNQPSSIYVGKTISVATGTTTTAGLTGVTNSYKREDVGLTLEIKPRVSSKDKVTLEATAVLENIVDDGTNNATGQPVTSKQEVKTQVILRHGESIIIGGLVKNYERNQVSKVPLLGDIPLLGALFRSKSKTLQQDNLVVILTPYIIDKSNELSKLQRELGMLSKIQEVYNKEIFKRIQENNDSN